MPALLLVSLLVLFLQWALAAEECADELAESGAGSFQLQYIILTSSLHVETLQY
jgi:hypothetical protein